MKFSFMTWVCPDYDLNQVITAAIRYGYDGVEPRAEADQAHGIDLKTTKKKRSEIKQQFTDAGVELSCIATSRQYSMADAAERTKSVELTKKFIDLAADVGCPFLRVFGGPIPEGVEKEECKQYVAEALRACGEHAAQTPVTVCLETHDSFSLARDAAETVRMADHERVKILWDVAHPFRQGETIAESWGYVKDLVRHLHVHDAMLGGGWDARLMGDGEIPHEEAIRHLASINFQGHLSGEWINPQWSLEELLPHELRVLRSYVP